MLAGNPEIISKCHLGCRAHIDIVVFYCRLLLVYLRYCNLRSEVSTESTITLAHTTKRIYVIRSA